MHDGLVGLRQGSKGSMDARSTVSGSPAIQCGHLTPGLMLAGPSCGDADQLPRRVHECCSTGLVIRATCAHKMDTCMLLVDASCWKGSLHASVRNNLPGRPATDIQAIHDCRDSAPEQRAQATQLRGEALQLLAPFLALPADQAQRVHAAVEAIVSDVFPVFSQVLQPLHPLWLHSQHPCQCCCSFAFLPVMPEKSHDATFWRCGSTRRSACLLLWKPLSFSCHLSGALSPLCPL